MTVSNLVESKPGFVWPALREQTARLSRRPRLERLPMPATKDDIDELEQALRWVQSSKRNNEHRIHALTEALTKAIKFLREGNKVENAPGFWVLGAFHDSLSYGEKGPVIVKPGLFQWACQQLEELYGPLQRIEHFRQSFDETHHPHRRHDDDTTG